LFKYKLYIPVDSLKFMIEQVNISTCPVNNR